MRSCTEEVAPFDRDEDPWLKGPCRCYLCSKRSKNMPRWTWNGCLWARIAKNEQDAYEDWQWTQGGIGAALDGTDI